MREWNKPEIQELDVTATAKTMSNGTVLDFASYDATNGEVIKYYYASNEKPGYGEVPDTDLKPVK